MVRVDGLLISQQLIVPAHWPMEVGHSILKALRRRTIPGSRLEQIATQLHALDITVAPPLEVISFLPLIEFARIHGLTMYDASYVQLAIDRNAPLATLDGAMRNAAKNLGVKLAL